MRHSNPSMNRYHYTVEEFLMNALLVRDLYRLEWGGGIFGGRGRMVFRENGGGSVVASIVKGELWKISDCQ